MTLILPTPPSANLYWRDRVVIPKGIIIPAGTRRPYVHRYRTPAADAYQLEVARIAHEHRPRTSTLNAEVALTMRWYRPRKIGDLDNHLKVVLDALQGWAYVNDAQIAELHAYRYYDKTNPRAEIEVRALPIPQLEL